MVDEVQCGVVQVTWRTPGVYVPQLGDEVVYLQVGHRKFLSANNNKLQGPWDSIISTAVSHSPPCLPPHHTLLYTTLLGCLGLEFLLHPAADNVYPCYDGSLTYTLLGLCFLMC